MWKYPLNIRYDVISEKLLESNKQLNLSLVWCTCSPSYLNIRIWDCLWLPSRLDASSINTVLFCAIVKSTVKLLDKLIFWIAGANHNCKVGKTQVNFGGASKEQCAQIRSMFLLANCWNTSRKCFVNFALYIVLWVYGKGSYLSLSCKLGSWRDSRWEW